MHYIIYVLIIYVLCTYDMFFIFYLIYERYFRKHFPNETHFHDYNRCKCKNIHISYRIVKYALHPMPKEYF